ncbi:MAG: DHH family phosphoesterase [Planctomycetes bacterium]|nr:DHH family phosphoesterase [Planctomycetota bacterium]
MQKKSHAKTLEKIADAVRRARSILTVSHANPDGDNLGSQAALVLAARKAGKKAVVALQDPLPHRLAFMAGPAATVSPARLEKLADACDLIVVLDTCSLSQLESFAGAISRRKEKTIVMDHHSMPEAIGRLRLIDPGAAATGMLVMELLDRLGWPIEGPIVQALAGAILTDTGWLRFSNTGLAAILAVARLVEKGLNPHRLYDQIFQSDRPHRIRLMTRMLDGMELHCSGRLAVMTISRRDFADTGATRDETENLINEAMRIAGVEIAALLVEGDGRIRVSLRSRRKVDVAEMARSLGGGGHVRASGAKLQMPLDQARQLVIQTCRKALK